MIIDNFASFGTNVNAFADGATVIVGDEIDLRDSRDIGAGTSMWLTLQVSTAFVGGTSVNFKLESDAAHPITPATATEHWASGAIPVADLVVGKRWVVEIPSGVYERWLGLTATTVGTVTAGAVDAFISQDKPMTTMTSRTYPEGIS